MRDMPEPWRTQAETHGIEPSYRGLARISGLGVETVRQAIVGTGRRPSATTVRALAQALRMPAAELDRWVGGPKATGTLEPWTPPPASARLTPKQRKALDGLIMSMVEPEERRRPSQPSRPAADAYGLAANTDEDTPGGDPGAPDES